MPDTRFSIARKFSTPNRFDAYLKQNNFQSQYREKAIQLVIIKLNYRSRILLQFCMSRPHATLRESFIGNKINFAIFRRAELMNAAHPQRDGNFN